MAPKSRTGKSLDLTSAPVELLWNGEVVDHGVTGAAMGHPFEGLAWLANLLAGRGRAMQAGEIVITGSALRTRFPEAGDEIIYRIEGLGETSVPYHAVARTSLPGNPAPGRLGRPAPARPAPP